MINKGLAQELYLQGYGYTDIGALLGVSKQRVHQVIKEYGNTGKKGRIKKYRKKNESCNLCKAKKAEVLHHIDFDNNNDNVKNLEPLCISCHMIRHTGRKHRLPKKKMNIKREYMITTLRLEEDLAEAVADEAWKLRKSKNQLINDILREYFERKIKERKDENS